MGDEAVVLDIGGVYELVLVQRNGRFIGHYTVKRTGRIFSFDGTGMSKKQIVRKFWDRAKAVKAS